MATSVKLRETDKARLERLQAEITATTGRKISQQDLLSELISLGEANRTALVDAAPPPDAAAIERLMRLPVSAKSIRRGRGPEHIDEDVYGARS